MHILFTYHPYIICSKLLCISIIIYHQCKSNIEYLNFLFYFYNIRHEMHRQNPIVMNNKMKGCRDIKITQYRNVTIINKIHQVKKNIKYLIIFTAMYFVFLINQTIIVSITYWFVQRTETSATVEIIFSANTCQEEINRRKKLSGQVLCELCCFCQPAISVLYSFVCICGIQSESEVMEIFVNHVSNSKIIAL